MSLRERVLPRLAVTVRAPRFHYAWVVTAVTFVALLAACGPAAAPPRPTDPHVIVSDAVKATAAVPSLRLHLEMATTMDRE